MVTVGVLIASMVTTVTAAMSTAVRDGELAADTTVVSAEDTVVLLAVMVATVTVAVATLVVTAVTLVVMPAIMAVMAAVMAVDMVATMAVANKNAHWGSESCPVSCFFLHDEAAC
jgi:hypothetical protein